MGDRIIVQRQAVRRGLQLRRSLSIPRDHPVNVFDIAQSIGVDVQFRDLPSLEGMFYRGPNPKIFLPCLGHRPRGRVAFSCAHELGHFELGHGTQVDEYLSDENGPPPERALHELAANTFASTLLMPRPAVLARFACREWHIQQVSELDLYRIAVELDVGYRTLCHHLRADLALVDDAWFNHHRKVSPKSLRRAIAPRTSCSRIVTLDKHWPDIPVDLEIDDYLATPCDLQARLPTSLRQEDEYDGRLILRAAIVGEMQAVINDRLITIRIARKSFCGLLKYRYLEEAQDQ